MAHADRPGQPEAGGPPAPEAWFARALPALRPREWRLAALLFAGLALAGVINRWTCDDAFIAFRVADNLAAGHGFVFNAGERVEAATCPLWVMVLAGARVGGLPIEWSACVLGVLAAATGLGLLSRLDSRPGVGLLTLLALPPLWHFASSGLESGLGVLVIGASYAACAHVEGRRRRAVGAALLASLLPLVRPDFGLFWLPALWLAQRELRGRVDKALVLAAGVAFPAAFEVFRLGYFGILTPNTALTKAAASADWGLGAAYLRDTVGTYALWVPLAALALLGRGWTPVRVALAAAGAAHAAYVVRIGGDFMHARLLLPGLVAMLAAWPSGGPRGVALLAVVTLHAGVCAVALRPGTLPEGVVDERANALLESGHPAPVTLLDHVRTEVVQVGLRARLAAEGRPGPDGSPPPCAEGVLLFHYDAAGQVAVRCDPLAPGVVGEGVRVVANGLVLGRLAFAAGPAVHVVDVLGLSDPIASRLEDDSTRHQAGHKKLLPLAWYFGRFAGPPSEGPEGGGFADAQDIRDAREALRCGALRELVEAVTAPLDGARFWANLVGALGRQRLAVPNRPAEAKARFCR